MLVLVLINDAHAELVRRTEIEFPEVSTSVGLAGAVVVLWETFGPSGSPGDVAIGEIKNYIVGVNRITPGTGSLVPLWSDDVIMNGVAQPIESVVREISGIEIFCFAGGSGDCRESGDLFFDNDVPVVQRGSTSGVPTFNIFSGEVGIPLDTGGVFVDLGAGVTINEWNGNTLIESHLITSVRITTTASLVPLPAAAWLLFGPVCGLALVRRRKTI